MKLIEVKGKISKKINKLKVLSDGITYDFYSDEDEAKAVDFVIDNIKESGLYGLQAALKFKEGVRENGGIDINCVSIRNSYKDLKIEASSTGKSLTGKIGKFAYFKEPIKPTSNESNKEVLDVFCRMIDVQLEFYNKTCIKEYRLTMDDIANHLIKKIKK